MEITQLSSDMEKRVRYSGEAEEESGEDQRDKRYLDHLSKYYKEIISRVRNAHSILVMGPGEAKGQFVKQLQDEGYNGSIVGIETVDKMTDRQIAARVKQHFLAEKS
jgi:stalled ribosome rescue protein Dom34